MKTPTFSGAALPKSALSRLGQCREPLLAWFAAHARDLPWRAGVKPLAIRHHGGIDFPPSSLPLRRAPYSTWVSEIMLQQTVVAAVVPYFRRWMAEFPDVRSLADADSERVLRAWAGLGYYARARNLHAGAKAVVERGCWPASGAEWREIPGIGEYTAGAIASLAFGQREPILDGNVVRVFSRLLGLDFLPGAGLAEKRVYWGLARHWVAGAGHGDDDGLNPAARAGDLNEGLMELGALVCVPSSPRCEVCPLVRACVAYRKGLTASLPPVKPRKKVEVVPAVAVLGRAPEGYLAEMRADGAFLAGHTLFPLLLRSEAQEWRLRFNQMYPQYLIKQESRAAEVRHTIMSSRYHVEVWNVVLSHKARTITPQKTTSAVRLIPEHKIDAILTSAFAKKIWEARKSPAPL